MRSRLPRSLTLAFSVALAACQPPPATDQAPAAARARIAILTAMPIELAPFLDAAQIERREVINGRTHHVGTIDGADVVMAAFGISMVNATMGAQLVLDRFDVGAIVVAGIAGGASPEIRIGDVTVPARWVQYQEHVFTDASRTGWRRGWRNEDLGAYGMMYPQRVWATAPNIEADAEHLKLWFDVDGALLAATRALVADIALEQCTPGGECVEHEPVLRVGGNGASGPTFVDDAAYREWIWEVFAPDSFDMETAAIGHVAYANGVPYVGVRAISDMAGANPNENRVESFAPVAANNAAAVVRALIRNWPGVPAAE
ncbi:MAG: phosphorylase [Acidobacteria bacterium]|nr:phosphorylase [Acidobacteriota bacterium]